MAVIQKKAKQSTVEALLSIQIEPLEEGGYLATSDDIQGLLAQGKTLVETLEIVQDVAAKLIESYLKHGDKLPPKIQRALRGHKITRATLAVPVTIPAETP